MKKISILLTMIIVFGLVSCDFGSPTESTTASQTAIQTTTSDNQTTLIDTTLVETTTQVETTVETTTEFVYDNRSLVPEDSQHLENIGDWQPVWSDEFNYEGLPDSDKWGYDVGGSGWGNNELQYYTREDLDNALVSDGTLKITARKEDYMGNEYTSARLITKYKGDWEYGKIQVKAKLPSGLGTWPAIWMLPTDWVYGGWPDSGEIDIMEYVGYDPGIVHGTIHTGAYNHSLGTQIGYSKTVADAETAFHVYELEWEPGFMEVFIDGVSYGRFGFNPTYNVDTDNSDAWPFDQRFHLILNLAVGGNWGGAQGVNPEAFPTSMEVDYVRVYQKDYAGLDQAAPEAVTNLSTLKTGTDSLKFYWTKAIDDIMVKEYEIYVDYALVGATSLNSYEVTDLFPSTMYRIDVVAVDFAGNRSTEATLNLATDNVRTNLGRIEAESYTFQSGVVREECLDEGGGQNVAWIGTNDYMEYQLLVEEAGTYQITYRIASLETAGQIKLYGKSSLPLVTTNLPVTGGWQVWQSVTTTTFTLSEGVTTFRIKASIGGFNLNYFEFEKVA
ncbi:MAG: family 16 glycosylhydrolase [Tenericutes bacterium]|nr:family 16 glycosylhydrolase [Mycoplasmatota bacterium]